MSYIEFDNSKPLDVIPIGRIAIDFNPTDMNKPLSESSNFNKYVGGSPANIAVGLARLGAKCGFIARVSDDQFGDYVENYIKADGIDVSHVFRCEHGENLGLTFTEILSPTQSSILMYRDGVADLQLVSPYINDETVAIQFFALNRHFLGQNRLNNDFHVCLRFKLTLHSTHSRRPRPSRRPKRSSDRRCRRSVPARV